MFVIVVYNALSRIMICYVFKKVFYGLKWSLKRYSYCRPSPELMNLFIQYRTSKWTRIKDRLRMGTYKIIFFCSEYYYLDNLKNSDRYHISLPFITIIKILTTQQLNYLKTLMTGEISFQDPIYAYWLKTEYFAK